jgi:hypothetical protein
LFVPSAPGPVRAAVVIVLMQALGLVAAAAFLLIESVTGDPDSLGRALLGAVLAVSGALVLYLCGRALLRVRPAARTPIIVLELLALPVGYSLAFQAGRIAYGGPILLAALAVLYLLFTPPAREALNRPDSS